MKRSGPVAAIVPVEDDPERVGRLLSERLSPEEIRGCSARATAKRRSEFLAGRIAAKRAVADHSGNRGDGEIRIVVDEGPAAGRPIAVSAESGERLPLWVSITHSEGIAVAVAGADPLGVDLVPARPLGPDFPREAFVAGELEQWAVWLGRERSHPLAGATAFAAKESALKWLGVGLRWPLHGLTVRPASPAEPVAMTGLPGTGVRFDALLTTAPTAPGRSVSLPDGGRTGRVELTGWLWMLRAQVLVLLAGPP